MSCAGYRLPVRIRQYVYFALYSRTITAQQIADRLALAPDEVSVAGSKNAVPPRPVDHAWKLTCREPGLCVDEQITSVIDRLLPRRAHVVALARELSAEGTNHGGARLSVVRYFDDTDGEAEQLSPPDAQLQKLPGQHQLLGWVLEPAVMAFLVDANAAIDVDEYN